MAINLLPLGAIPKATEITSWILRELYRAGTPHVATFLQNPTGHVERLGDLLVWQGGHGTRVLAGLEQVQEHSLRIQSL